MSQTVTKLANHKKVRQKLHLIKIFLLNLHDK